MESEQNNTPDGKDIAKTDTSTGKNREYTAQPDNAVVEYPVGHSHPPKHSQFSSTHQPPDQVKKKATLAKKRATRELLKELLNMQYQFEENSQIKQELEKTFGKKAVKAGTVLDIMAMRQIIKSVKGNNTNAFREVLVQAYGLPKQQLEHSGPDGGPIETANNHVHTTVIIENPHNESS